MNDEIRDDAVAQPAPEAAAPADPPRQPESELEAAVAAFDAREQTRAVQPRAGYEPFSIRDVDRRVWIGAGVVLVLIALAAGGPPWHTRFWFSLAIFLLVMAPVFAGALFFWRRQM